MKEDRLIQNVLESGIILTSYHLLTKLPVLEDGHSKIIIEEDEFNLRVDKTRGTW